MIEEATLRQHVRERWGLELRRNAGAPPRYDDEIGKRGYRGIGTALEKCLEEAQTEDVACLVPARTETGWFQDLVFQGEIWFLKSRVRFDGEKSGAPFPSAVVRFGPEIRPGVVWDETLGHS